MRDIFAVVPVNDDDILKQNLLRSPDIQEGTLAYDIIRGASNAGQAFNSAIERHGKLYRWLLFVHQDVYLPLGFVKRFIARADNIRTAHDDIAVIGLFGCSQDGDYFGKVWCSANAKELSGGTWRGESITSLDEYCFALHTADNLRFDEELPSFHLFGTDIVKIAEHSGKRTAVATIPVIHNSRPVVSISGAYSEAWQYMRQKYRNQLPIPTLVCDIKGNGFRLKYQNLRMRLKYSFRNDRGISNVDPAEKSKLLGYD